MSGDVYVLGVRINNLSQAEAIELIENAIRERSGTHSIFIANAHTLNLASNDLQYRAVLNRASRVFADGTGARWGARLRGVILKDNLVGTDLIPKLFDETAGKGYRYYLLGADSNTIERAARWASREYTGWNLAGFHHGYIASEDESRVIQEINAAHPDMLLVGMGNPRQECWIHRHQAAIRVQVCIGVGGLFDHWAGTLTRAPLWIRNRGFEWLQLLMQQPQKWRRYLLGNPAFLVKVCRYWRSDRRLHKTEMLLSPSVK